MVNIITLVSLLTLMSLVSNTKLIMQDDSEFDYKSSFLKLLSQFNSLQEDNRNIMKSITEIMNDNKSITARLTTIETTFLKKEEFNIIKKEINDLKSNMDNKVTNELYTKFENYKEKTDEIEKAFNYMKNDISMAQKKTVELEKIIINFKSNQELILSNFTNASKEEMSSFQSHILNLYKDEIKSNFTS